VIALDALNPQVASRLARAMDRWRRYTPELQEHMKKALQQVAGQASCRTTCAKSSAKPWPIKQFNPNQRKSMKRVSLTQYLVEEQRLHNNIPAELRLLIEVVARACKTISHSVGKGALGDILGSADTENIQGEVQKKLDVISNEILLEANEWGGHLAAMASEEMESIHPIPNRYPMGEYMLLFDPLDGSSNIDVNVSIGTIFSVLKAPEGMGQPTEADFMQPGSSRSRPAMPCTARRPCWCSPPATACTASRSTARWVPGC
jgi:hypothetical protein